MIRPNDIVYISGRMTGLEDWGQANFDAAEEFLRKKFGCIIHNPSRSFSRITNLPRHVYMRHDLHLILESTALFFLKGWESSVGAQWEYSIAKELNLRRYYQHKLLP